MSYHNAIEARDLDLHPKPQGDDRSTKPDSYEESGSSAAYTPQLSHMFPLAAQDPPISLKAILLETERRLLIQALEETNHNAPEAAKLLNISESWLYNRIRRFGLLSRRKR